MYLITLIYHRRTVHSVPLVQLAVAGIINNNNNDNRVYTPLSEKCSQSRVFISQCHINHIIQYYEYFI